jgi:hypothetical protein
MVNQVWMNDEVYMFNPEQMNVTKALELFQQTPPHRQEHSPHAWTKPIYGTHPRLTSPINDKALLPPADLTRIQEITGTLLFYASAIDSTMLVALDTIASNQYRGTQATAQALTQLSSYAAAHPDATFRYTASDIYLHIHSNASYLSEAKAKSRARGTFFRSSRTPDLSETPYPNATPPPHNGAIYTISSIMRNVVASATEAEQSQKYDTIENQTMYSQDYIFRIFRRFIGILFENSNRECMY